MKILFLVRKLDFGGAERQLILLANELGRRGHNVAIAVFYSGGRLEDEVDGAHVRLIPLGKNSRWGLLSFVWKVLRLVGREQPDVLHGWMSTPNLLASLVGLLHPKMRVFWCIRCSNLETVLELGPVDKAVNSFECRVSRFADCIVVNSQAGVEYFASRGVPRERMIHVPNGIEVNGLYPDSAAGERMRAAWEIGGSDRLIGLVGRVDPAKAHAVFLKAAAILARDTAGLRFVCLGNGPAAYLEKLKAISRDLGLEQTVLWIPACSSMRAVYNALDIVCLPSLSEGFSNVIAEAMACGRHCVVTDVGDSSFLVSDTGVVVPPNDAEALAEGLRRGLAAAKNSNESGRQRILENFTVTNLADRTEKVLLKFSSDDRQAKQDCPPEPARTP